MAKFNPQDHVMDMRGKDYLEVKWRVVWFREEHPKGTIETSIVADNVMKATIIDADGNILATGHGTPKMQGVAKSRPYEGAETAAIGRALAHAGYGTQFTGEEEGEHLADAPVEQGIKKAKSLAEEAQNLGGVSVYNTVVEAGLAENEYSAKNALAKCRTGYDTNDKAVAWMKLYRGWRDSGLDSDPAAEKANKGEKLK